MEKIKILHVDIGGCEGCAISFFRALPLIKDFSSPVCRYNVESEIPLSDSYDIAFVSGSVCMNSEAVELLRKIREHAKILVAYGSCASFGGITRFCKGGQEPRPEHGTFLSLNSVVKVDYSIPGCPPPPQMVRVFVMLISRGQEERLSVFKAVSTLRKLSGFDLIDDVVLSGLCVGCGACELSCPTGAIRLVKGKPELIVEKCIRCGTCYVRCPKATHILLKRLQSIV